MAEIILTGDALEQLRHLPPDTLSNRAIRYLSFLHTAMKCSSQK